MKAVAPDGYMSMQPETQVPLSLIPVHMMVQHVMMSWQAVPQSE
jgi:hypothetical protein